MEFNGGGSYSVRKVLCSEPRKLEEDVKVLERRKTEKKFNFCCHQLPTQWKVWEKIQLIPDSLEFYNLLPEHAIFTLLVLAGELLPFSVTGTSDIAIIDKSFLVSM